jgi:hypothetical protein
MQIYQDQTNNIRYEESPAELPGGVISSCSGRKTREMHEKSLEKASSRGPNAQSTLLPDAYCST